MKEIEWQPTPEKFKYFREIAGTQRQAAKILRVSSRTVQNWESPVGTKEHRKMSTGLFEHFLTKTLCRLKKEVAEIEDELKNLQSEENRNG